jgi:hypothetical protein
MRSNCFKDLDRTFRIQIIAFLALMQIDDSGNQMSASPRKRRSAIKMRSAAECSRFADQAIE